MSEEEPGTLARKLKDDLCCPKCGSKRFYLVTQIRDSLSIADNKRLEIYPSEVEYLFNRSSLDTCSFMECAECDYRIDKDSKLFSAIASLKK